MTTQAEQGTEVKHVHIEPPQFQVAEFTITGVVPFVQHRFSEKAQREMEKVQEQGDTSGRKKKKTPKDFHKDYEESMHVTSAGKHGIPASAFRNAMIAACRKTSMTMVAAKISVFVLADDYSVDGIPLVLFTKGKPKMRKDHVRLAKGAPDIHARAMWDPGWQVKLRIKFDSAQFKTEDVAALVMWAGYVGVGEGRPLSPQSPGVDWGRFEIV